MFRFLAGLMLVAATFSLTPAFAGGPNSAPGQVSAAAQSPTQTVQALVLPFVRGNAAQPGCNAATGHFAGCPVTARLRYRLQHARENGNIVCRCQNLPRHIFTRPVSNNGTVAQVNVTWYYGTQQYTTTFVLVRRNGRWLVDNMYCAGKPRTTVYRYPAGPCM